MNANWPAKTLSFCYGDKIVVHVHAPYGANKFKYKNVYLYHLSDFEWILVWNHLVALNISP